MLMQNFKSAADLEITDAEQVCLAKVLGMLERGDLIDVPQDAKCENGFNMGTQGRGCGTPACIGGWVAILMGIEQMPYVDSYLPSFEKNAGMCDLYWRVTAASASQAATALRSYLTTGDAKWREAIGEASGLTGDR